MRGFATPLFVAWLVWNGWAPAHAGTEEFSTFSVYAQEEDDESVLDHLLTRPPREWRHEWETSPQALRTSQGCLTSGQWFIDTRLKLRAPLGRGARFGLDVRQDESDRGSLQYFDFSFRFPLGLGTPGFIFRPSFDKSLQDLALFWEAGAETAATVARVTFTFEDAFNNLWAFRQTRVGNISEPYERHPFEPAFWLRAERPAWRCELAGQWLTPSRKRLARDAVNGVEPRGTLWGALAFAALEAKTPALEIEIAGSGRQALSRLTLPGTQDYGGDYRRQWTFEAAARRALAGALAAEARWIYQDRFEDSDPPFVSRTLGCVDRVLQLELAWRNAPWSARVGGLHDRITMGQEGDSLASYGTRTESRAYVGLSVRLGAVTLHAVEAIELDPEPYEVWWAHDKGFFHLQTTF